MMYAVHTAPPPHRVRPTRTAPHRANANAQGTRVVASSPCGKTRATQLLLPHHTHKLYLGLF